MQVQQSLHPICRWLCSRATLPAVILGLLAGVNTTELCPIGAFVFFWTVPSDARALKRGTNPCPCTYIYNDISDEPSGISGRVSTAARCPGDVPPRRHSTPEYIMYMRVFDLTLHEGLTDLTMPCSPRETSRPQSTHIPRVSGSRHLLSRRLRRATGIKHAVLVRLSTTFVRVLARH